MIVNSPYSVGSGVLATCSMSCSLRPRCRMRSAMDTSRSPCASANARHCSASIIVPSSLTISHRAPDGCNPARVERSTAASVWPGRWRTPPGTARSGITCPGRVRSVACVSALPRVRMVIARSEAEMPVVMTSRESTVTAYAVPLRSSFTIVMGGRWRRSRSSPVMPTQMYPLVYRIMNAVRSAVAFSAAKMRSPSFSRPSSSTTITAWPSAMALMASSMGSMRTASCSDTGLLVGEGRAEV